MADAPPWEGERPVTPEGEGEIGPIGLLGCITWGLTHSFPSCSAGSAAAVLTPLGCDSVSPRALGRQTPGLLFQCQEQRAP